MRSLRARCPARGGLCGVRCGARCRLDAGLGASITWPLSCALNLCLQPVPPTQPAWPSAYHHESSGPEPSASRPDLSYSPGSEGCHGPWPSCAPFQPTIQVEADLLRSGAAVQARSAHRSARGRAPGRSRATTAVSSRSEATTSRFEKVQFSSVWEANICFVLAVRRRYVMLCLFLF